MTDPHGAIVGYNARPAGCKISELFPFLNENHIDRCEMSDHPHQIHAAFDAAGHDI